MVKQWKDRSGKTAQKKQKSQQRAVPKQRKSTNPHSDGIKSNRNPKRKSQSQQP